MPPQTPGRDLPESVEAVVYKIHFDLAGEARRVAVEELLGKRPELRAGIIDRLAYLEATEIALAAARSVRRGPDGERMPAAPGTQIGGYVLERLLGRGGFGEVWLAQQETPIRRQVALKLLAAGIDDGQAVTRFDLERDALGLLQHDGVAKVFDAGTTDDGRPYFVMEHVDGVPITEHCDALGLDVRARLELFVKICAGVQHAHQKGLIHRDIKPSNVLVAVQDGVARPKIIDFGVAKALHGDLRDHARRTEGQRLLGTPEYMSPEQAAGEDVDTRTDVHALGVLLFELLTGRLPFPSERLREGGLGDVARILRDEDAPLPSAALLDQQDPDAIAARRRTDARALAELLRRDLDWIVLRSLRKDREARYASVSALAADVSRALDDEPVTARPPSTSYLLRKFVRRHRRGVVSAAAGIVLAVLALTGAVTGLVAINRARSEAVTERDRATTNLYSASVVAASLALRRDGDVAAARRSLGAAPPALRGWEWRLLDGRLDDSVRTVEIGGHVRDLAVVPGADTVIAAMYDGRLLRLDADEPELIDETRSSRVSLDLHPDTHTVAVVSEDGRLAVFDVRSGQPLDNARYESRVVLRCVRFSPRGDRLAFGGKGGSLFVEPFPPSGPPQRATIGTDITAIDLSPDGALCAIGDADGTVRIVRSDDLRVAREFLAHDDVVLDVRFALDGKALATASADLSVALWDLGHPDGPPLWRRTLTSKCRSIQFAPDGRQLAVSGGHMDSLVAVLDASNGAVLRRLHGHEQGVDGLAWSADGERLFTAGRFGVLRVFRPADIGGLFRLPCGLGTIDVVTDADGGRVFACAMDGTLVCWNSRDGSVEWTAEAPHDLQSIAFGGDRIFGVDAAGFVHAFDASSGESLASGANLGTPLRDTALALDGHTLVVAASSGKTFFLDPIRLEPLGEPLQLAGRQPVLAFDPRTGRLAAGLQPGKLDLVSVAERKVIRELAFDEAGGMVYPAFAPDGHELAVGFGDGSIALIDPDTGAVRSVMHSHVGPIRGVAYSPDGTRLVSAGEDQRLIVYDAARTAEILTLDSPGAPVYAPCFSPDGNTLYACVSVFTRLGHVFGWRAR